ncbi:hypothetical protein Taro_014279 [Colocasia esculenta]|uniref:Uncharacterized protein n=1 Tax=Colocasia esculenta TaxID=4460 RepID=A0A843U8M7_COLES|nr:hypothetical protein [Colocasia esculenta]
MTGSRLELEELGMKLDEAFSPRILLLLGLSSRSSKPPQCVRADHGKIAESTAKRRQSICYLHAIVKYSVSYSYTRLPMSRAITLCTNIPCTHLSFYMGLGGGATASAVTSTRLLPTSLRPAMHSPPCTLPPFPSYASLLSHQMPPSQLLRPRLKSSYLCSLPFLFPLPPTPPPSFPPPTSSTSEAASRRRHRPRRRFH